ncbi:MAG TPA: hypothetical protein VF885_08610 [Arthrobacter sp.]
MKNTETPKKKGLRKVAAGIVGAALLAATTAGTTLGVWQEQQDGGSAAVEAGELGLELGEDRGWFDVTDLAPNNLPTPVDPASHAITPGDRLERVQEISVKLSGDNIRAELTADVKKLTGTLADQGLSGTVRLVKGSYTPTSGLHPGPDVVTTTPISDNAAAPQFTFSSAVAPADGKYTVLIDLVFAQAAAGGTGASAVLSDTTFNLKQVRSVASPLWDIPDAGLRYVIAGELNVPEAELTEADALRLTQLDLWQVPVSSIEGLQVAKNLTGLGLGRTMVSDISPVTGLDKLESFSGAQTLIADLSPLAGKGIKSIDLSGMSAITDLAVLSPMIDLESVNLSFNPQLSDLSALSGKNKLNDIYIRNTNVSNLEPLRNDLALTVIDATNSKVTDWSPVAHVATVLGRP